MVWHLPEVTCVHVFLNFYINIFYLIQSPKYFLLDVLWFWEYISILRSISLMCDETMAWPQWLLWRKILNSNTATPCGPVGAISLKPPNTQLFQFILLKNDNLSYLNLLYVFVRKQLPCVCGLSCLASVLFPTWADAVFYWSWTRKCTALPIVLIVQNCLATWLMS